MKPSSDNMILILAERQEGDKRTLHLMKGTSKRIKLTRDSRNNIITFQLKQSYFYQVTYLLKFVSHHSVKEADTSNLCISNITQVFKNNPFL